MTSAYGGADFTAVEAAADPRRIGVKWLSNRVLPERIHQKTPDTMKPAVDGSAIGVNVATFPVERPGP